MSLLNPIQNNQLTPAERAAIRVKKQTKILADQLISGWEFGFDAIWKSENPAQVLAKIGTDAKEIFDLSAATVQLMAAILPTRRPQDWQRIQAKIQSKPATTEHPDGTVTIDED